jgi:nucleotide-binding universal stress UspA family protein
MFRHLLVPTDGTALSAKAVAAAIAMASAASARVTVLHVVEPYPLQGAWAAEGSVIAELQPEAYERRSRDYAEQVLASVAAAAAAASVDCQTLGVVEHSAAQAIIATAQEEGCDLIVMASHGRRGFKSFLLGSETQKVLTHSTIPVLIYR